jgi:alpha-glucosidase (family GH31 glycosyl hydrolase)
MITRKALDKLGLQDVFLLTRANFPGSGRYSAVWYGDNGASWEFM